MCQLFLKLSTVYITDLLTGDIGRQAVSHGTGLAVCYSLEVVCTLGTAVVEKRLTGTSVAVVEIALGTSYPGDGAWSCRWGRATGSLTAVMLQRTFCWVNEYRPSGW